MKRQYQFENLVFEGGGTRCIAYVGAIKVLEKKDIMKDIKRVGGASAGAIVAALLSVGYSYKELYSNLLEVEFKHVKDRSIFFLFNLIRLYRNYGWFEGATFDKWFKSLIEKKVKRDITFAELYKLRGKNGVRELYVVGSDLNTQQEIIFSHETFPDMPITTAVRISMSLPLMFRAVEYNNRLFVDGGLYFNYPVDIFDKAKYLSEKKSSKEKNREIYNEKTLGFRIDTKPEIYYQLGEEYPKPMQINSLSHFVAIILEGIFNVHSRHKKERDAPRTIFIDSKGIGPMKFEIPLAIRKKLVKSGEKATLGYFEWYENPSKERVIV